MKQRKYFRKLLSLVIAASMIVTMMPMSVFADEVPAADVMIEDYADQVAEDVDVADSEVIEEAAVVPEEAGTEIAAPAEEPVFEDGPVEEAGDELTARILSATVKGKVTGEGVLFNAQLAGVSVRVLTPIVKTPAGSYMTADLIDAEEYAEAAAAKYYGMAASDLYGLELHFYNKKGKEIKNITTSKITVEVDGFEAALYSIGRLSGDSVVGQKKSAEPTFALTAGKAYTYVIAGLVDDGVPRANGTTAKNGTQNFDLDNDGFNVKVSAPKGAFSGKVTMEANEVSGESVQDVVDDALTSVDNTVIGAYDISFHNSSSGAELQPSKDVTVNIATPLDMSKTYKLVHIGDDGEASVVDGAAFSTEGVSYAAGEFSVYVIVQVDDTGSLNFEKIFGDAKVTVKAPVGAFDAGTQMVIQSVDADDLLKVVASLGCDRTYSFNAIDIGFYKDGIEVEPKVPVEVTWESVDIDTADEQVVHLKDDGTVEIVKDAVITEDKAVFTAESFSTYVTTRHSEIDLTTEPALSKIIFDPSTIQRPDTMASGNLSETHPTFDNYTYLNATFVDSEGRVSDDPVITLGTFDYWDCDGDGNKIEETKKTYVYYRTEKTAADSDLIVKLAEGEKIYLHYKPTPVTVTYKVIYNGTTYTLTDGNLPGALVTALGAEDAAQLEVNGPASVESSTEVPQAITVDIPRGYTATVQIGNTQLGRLGDEPTYSVSNDKVITKNGELILEDVYDFPASTTEQTVTVNLTKRSSFTFNAHYFLRTVYTGGNSSRYGDYRLSQHPDSRITGDGSLNNNAQKPFSADTVSWTFTTNNKRDSNKNQTGDQWMVDALEINGTTIEIPYANPGDTLPVSKTTTLPSGTVITVSLTGIVQQSDNNNRTNYRRTYTITAENCYENIVISGGNIVDLDVSEEIIPEVLDNVEYSFRGYATSDAAYSGSGLGWQSWGVGEPIAVGNNQSVSGSRNYNMYGFNQTNNNAMRFSVPVGYVNPMIAYVSTLEADLISNVTLGSGLTRGAKTDGYYPINGDPTNGYYYFRISGNSNNSVALLRIKAELALYDVSYAEGETGTDSDIEMPAYDDSGYNVVDKPYVVVNKSAPHDRNGKYIFMYYTIDGDRTDTHYSPSEKIPLERIYQLGVYDSAKKRYVIPFVAHWERTADVDKIPFTADIYLDDEFAETVHTTVPEGSSVYIDIDSQTMVDFMEKYNWQLFYDELGSDPFVRQVSEDNNSVELRIYSKFYVYHSATDTLELHTKKEMEVTDDQGNRSIGKLNLAGLTTEGYYYGGYYKDYLGAHVGNTTDGKNLVKEAADKNNSEGLLSTADIEALSKGGAVVIPEYEGKFDENDEEHTNRLSLYDPVANENHLTYWTRANAFTTSLKNSDTSWFGNRGKDTEVLQTGGTGTSVEIARAGIYYLHEVHPKYLATPKVATVRDNYGNGDITKMFLLSVADLNIFRTGGVNIEKNETGSDKKGSFAKSFTLTKYDDGTNAVVAQETKTAKQLYDAYGYVIVTDGGSCLEDGSYKLDPYWITYDNVTVHGSDVTESGHVRTITVSGNVVS